MLYYTLRNILQQINEEELFTQCHAGGRKEDAIILITFKERIDISCYVTYSKDWDREGDAPNILKDCNIVEV